MTKISVEQKLFYSPNQYPTHLMVELDVINAKKESFGQSLLGTEQNFTCNSKENINNLRQQAGMFCTNGKFNIG